MSDLATLGLRIESTEADVAEKRLDGLAASAAKANRATDALATGSISADSAIGKMVASIERGVRDLVAMGQAQLILAQHSQQAAGATNAMAASTDRLSAQARAAGAAVGQLDSHVDAYRQSLLAVDAAARNANDNLAAMPAIHGRATASTKALQQSTLNMTRQFADVGVTAAMGMNPLMILIQQGPQIADSFQVAGQAGLGFKAVMAGLVTQLGLVTVAGGAVAASQFAAAEAAVADAVAKNAAAISAAKLAASELVAAGAAGVGVEAQTALAIATARDTLAKEAATAAAAQLTAANAGLATSATAVGAATTFAMGPVLIILLAVAAAAAAIALPFAVAAQQIGAENKNLVNELGLTEKQIAKVKDTGVTMGDVLTGVWVATSKMLTEAFGPEIEAVSKWFGDLYQGIVDGTVAANRAVVGGFGGAFAAVKATWSLLPSALGDAAYSAANLVLRSISAMINGGVGLLNGLIAKANAVASAIPGLDVLIPQLSPVAVLALANPFAGAMAHVGSEGGAALVRGYENSTRGFDSVLARFASETEAAQRRRILREAGDDSGGNDSAGSAGRQRQAREVEEIQRMWAGVNQEVRELNINVPKVLGPLDQAIRNLSQVDDLIRSAGAGMENSFGRAGKALSGLVEGLSSYRLQMAEIAQAVRDDKLFETEAVRERGRVELQTYGDMAGAAKSFFGEKTAAYKALQAVEMAYRAFQFASAVRAMAMDTAETGSGIANSLARGAASVAAGVAKVFEQMGVWGFPVAAALLGVVASVAGGALGGGGSGSAPVMPTTNTGTGTVLGNSGEQSESLSKSLEMSERYWNRDLDYSSKMVTSLRAIQTNIGNLTTAIAREMNVGGGLDPTGLNQGPTTSGGFLGLFATTRSSSVVGSGINLSGGQLADLISQGVSGALYQIVQTTRTSSGFFGIGGGTRTTNSEVTSGIDQGLSQELSRVLASLRDGVLTAAGQLGVDGARAVLDTFQVNLGRISFDGMSSSEVTAALNAVFSAVGDDMARAILPGLDAFQQAGEGLFETLTRLATEYQVVDQVMTLLGRSFGPVGLGSIEARNRLVELAGGLEAFSESADFFAENFLTEAQRIAPIQAAVAAELARLGIASDISRTAFADLVMGLDVSTEAGATMYAALMRLAPALDQVMDYTEETTGVIGNATDLARERRELELRLLEAQGRISEALAARRADELAAMDATLRPLQLAIWAAQDLARAQEELATAQREAAEAAEREAQRVAQIAQTRANMEIELLEAQGRAAEAVAARRALELAALDETLRPLQLAIYAAQDLAAAAAELAAAQAEAARIAQEAADRAAQIARQRTDLEIELMDAQGNSVGALAARRALELAALDESLRPLQEVIWATLDLAAANEASAQAQRDAAAAAEEAARIAAAISAQRQDLEIQLLEAQGDAAGALAARRQLELAALDPTLRALQQQIWAAQELAAASLEAASAQQQAADAARSIALQRRQLEIELMRATGNTAGAVAATREDELAALDESLRAIQMAIYAAQDYAAAQEAAAQAQQAAAAAAAQAEQEYQQRVETARGALSQAYQREAATLQGVIDKFGSFGDSLRAFRDTLGQADDATASYASRRAEFLRTANLARLGDEAALGALQGVSQAFLASSLENASSNLAYQRDIAAVRAAVDAAIGTADRGKTNAERQLEALQGSVSGLVEVNESVLSVRDAIRDLMLVMGGQAPVGVSIPSPSAATYAPDFTPVALTTSSTSALGLTDPVDLVAEVRGLRQELAGLRAEQMAGHSAIATNTGKTARTLDGWDENGLPEERAA